MAHSGRFFSFLRKPVLWREEAVRAPSHSPTCWLYHELSSSPPPYLSRDAPSSGAAEAPTSAASPITRLPQSVRPAPPRHTSGRPGHTARAKIVHSDFCAPSSFPRRHKGSRERRRCPYAPCHALPHPRLRPDSLPRLRRHATDRPTSRLHCRPLPKQCAKTKFTFVNLENGHEIHRPPPWSKISPTRRV